MDFPTHQLRLSLPQCILINIDGSITISLLIKSKMASLKIISVPIEIICYIASYLLDVFRTLSASTSECYCWTDSAITLAWLNQFFPMENLCRQSRLGCHSFLEFLGVMFRRTPQSRGLRGLAPDLFETHALW